ncbi:MAG TPA: rhamnulokinase [Anaerohalosphaeraceae bacterium]|nr:rhamnulokinase [Anaerohalosphaeraceae bacterium]HOL30538.1 rhamnulokinase [Anaerohalosphaeraceae bacterium]HOM75210.1 rhamnulokinase [Anaerohalosphaeraceae bacterium]HPC63996.1 rhamnulokinase [Anaerohalosphaeraceae bacterium]HPO69963.1 rhamnulokinase [Anaerohalosphaeraceae bacterium]
MAEVHAYAAIDLGAESGRVVKGILQDGKLRLEEISRFPNGMVPIGGQYCWNLVRLYESMLEAFKKCAGSDVPIESIGVDSWGVDFVLLARDETQMGLPVAYRDSRTDGMMETLFKRIPSETIYEKTGIAFLKFNSIYQLLALAEKKSEALKNAAHFLMIPDYFHYLFTGKLTNEYTDATTSQGINLKTKSWDEDIFKAIGVSPSILHPLIKPGTTIGPISSHLQAVTGLGPIPVIAPGTHDTASAVAAVPAEGKNWAYISSGTWSLMGIEADSPVSSPKAFEYNFTNEGGVFDTIRFLKNIMGLWLVQRCRAAFAKELDYGTLTQMAAQAPAFASLIDPDRDMFMNPPSMTEAIAAFCRKTGQPVPASEGAYVRCCLESLALQYRLVMQQLCEIYGTRIEKLHIVGGGTQNTLLNQLAADATGTTVITGPVEATVIGNIAMQAIGLGHIPSLAEARKIIRQSFEMHTYAPKNTAAWEAPFERFMKLKKARI